MSRNYVFHVVLLNIQNNKYYITYSYRPDNYSYSIKKYKKFLLAKIEDNKSLIYSASE